MAPNKPKPKKKEALKETKSMESIIDAIKKENEELQETTQDGYKEIEKQLNIFHKTLNQRMSDMTKELDSCKQRIKKFEEYAEKMLEKLQNLSIELKKGFQGMCL